MLFNSKVFKKGNKSIVFCSYAKEALPGEGGVNYVAHPNFKTSRVGIYKCLLLIVGFAVTVAIWPREVAVVYALSLLFGPRRLSEFTLAGPH